MERVINRVKQIVLSPEDALSEVKSESMTVAGAMKEYVAIVAAIPAAATFLGLIGHANFFRNLIFSAVIYVMGCVSVLIFGKIVDALAPRFSSTKSDLNAFKLSAYAFTPGFVAGVFNINPNLSIFGLLGSLYGIYVFYLGAPVLMQTAEDKKVLYTVACIVAMFVVMAILWSIVTGLVWSGTYGYRY